MCGKEEECGKEDEKKSGVDEKVEWIRLRRWKGKKTIKQMPSWFIKDLAHKYLNRCDIIWKVMFILIKLSGRIGADESRSSVMFCKKA